MHLHWKLISSLTRAGSMLRVVRWAARLDGEPRRWIYRECIYEAGRDGLLADEEDASRALLQTRYGTEPDLCTHENLADIIHTEATAPC